VTGDDSTARSSEPSAPNAPQLPAEIAARIQRLKEEAAALAASGDWAAALERLMAARKSLPFPTTRWEEARDLCCEIAEAYYRLGDFKKSREEWQLLRIFWFDFAKRNLHAVMRLGQTWCETENAEEGAKLLARVVRRGGWELLRGEDPKYIAIMKEHAPAPADGWPQE
jgi:hypothetical protein